MKRAASQAGRSPGARGQALRGAPRCPSGRPAARQPRDEGRHVDSKPPRRGSDRHRRARHRCSHGRRERHHHAPGRPRIRQSGPHRAARPPRSQRPARRKRQRARWPRRLQLGPHRAAGPVRRVGPVGSGPLGTGRPDTCPAGSACRPGPARLGNRLPDHPTSPPSFAHPPIAQPPHPPVTPPPHPPPPRPTAVDAGDAWVPLTAALGDHRPDGALGDVKELGQVHGRDGGLGAIQPGDEAGADPLGGAGDDRDLHSTR